MFRMFSRRVPPCRSVYDDDCMNSSSIIVRICHSVLLGEMKSLRGIYLVGKESFVGIYFSCFVLESEAPKSEKRNTQYMFFRIVGILYPHAMTGVIIVPYFIDAFFYHSSHLLGRNA
jgi:hypothetical protein